MIIEILCLISVCIDKKTQRPICQAPRKLRDNPEYNFDQCCGEERHAHNLITSVDSGIPRFLFAAQAIH